MWGAWSGYSPLCFSGDEWCLRLPAAGVGELSSALSSACGTPGNVVRDQDGETAPAAASEDWRDFGDRVEQQAERELEQHRPTVEPLQLLGALLRRGVSVEPSGKQTYDQRSPPSPFAGRAFVATGGCSLRLETEEGPANSISLLLQSEHFKLRDAVSVSNDTPLPLLLRQCRHRDTAGSEPSDAGGRRASGGAAAALGVDTVTSAVAELWETAIQGWHEENHHLSLFDTDSSVTRSGSLYGVRNSGTPGGGPERSLQLLNILLERQQRAEQQQQERGAPLSHSPTAVYISPSPHEEAVQVQLERLARVAETVASEDAAPHEQKQMQSGLSASPSNHGSGESCIWCRFESASAQELRQLEEQEWRRTLRGEAETVPPAVWPIPQLVLPGETVLFAWDDYRSLPCIEVTYFPWLQKQYQIEKLAATMGSNRNGRSKAVPPVMELRSLERPLVACIPLHPNVRGVVPLSPLPSSCWLLFRVVRCAGRLRLQIAPASELLGIPSPVASTPEAARQQQQQQNSDSQVPEAGASTASAANSSPHCIWAVEEGDQVAISPDDVDVQSLLVLPRYFQLPVVNKELSVGCSRNSRSSGMDSRVPPWAFASLCRFADTIVESYAPDRRAACTAAAAAARSAVAARGELELAEAMLPLRPTPEPPTFELRIEVPRVQLSILSQGAVTDPLSRQVWKQALTSSGSVLTDAFGAADSEGSK